MMTGQPLVYSQILEDGQHRNGVRGRDDAPEKKRNEHRQADQPMHKVSGHQGGEEHAYVGEQQQRYGIPKQLPHVQLDAAFEDQRRKKQYQNHIGRQPIGTVTGLKGRQDGKLNDSQEQAAQDQGHRVGNPQAFRQHRDDRSGDEQPNQEFYSRGWSHLRNASLSSCSNSLTKTWHASPLTKAALTSGRKR